ncbi:type VI secretion system protein TssA [Marinimicrobium alkaliphilum]|uniref:type VI secretion system protein TssA n=1 Tax=Marinimicrobium alkaliphilum TaxID=2202654 RepID=UPI000DBA557B|nr:type VI secretion system protein TssA [Marinimicrobium alkaliphilum]
MASERVIDLDALLAPIAETTPAGNDPREDASPQSLYQTLKRERSSARAAERKTVHDGNDQEADSHWQNVLSMAPTLIQEQAKDLEVASWLTEALVRKHGFRGLRDAFALIHGLVQNFWNDLYPRPDEDGIETRVAPLSGLNGEGAEGVLIAPIRKVSITEGNPPAPFSLWQYQQALDIQKLPDEDARQTKEQTLGYSLYDIERAVAESSDTFFIEQRDHLDEALAHYRACSETLDNHCGAEYAPPVRNILSVLEECRGAMSHLGKDKYPVAGEHTESASSDGDKSANSDVPVSTNHIKKKALDREEAFRQLREISDFFLKTEPHSPVSYVLQKAVKWGNMRLDELIAELIPDSSSRAHYSELTGVDINDD